MFPCNVNIFFFFVELTTLGIWLNFDWMVHYVECPNVLTTNIQKGQFCVMTVTDTKCWLLLGLQESLHKNLPYFFDRSRGNHFPPHSHTFLGVYSLKGSNLGLVRLSKFNREQTNEKTVSYLGFDTIYQLLINLLFRSQFYLQSKRTWAKIRTYLYNTPLKASRGT